VDGTPNPDAPILTEKSLRVAIKRLHEEFIFIGLTEEALATEKLFLAMFQMSLPAGYEFPQKLKYRKNSLHTKSSHAFLSKNLTDSNWTDFYDEALYHEAQKIFYNRCKLFNISTFLSFTFNKL
jgi:hypothetical protein